MSTKAENNRDMVRVEKDLSNELISVKLSVKEVSILTGENVRTVRRKAANGIYKTEIGKVKGQKDSYLIYLSSLPIEAQKKYHQEKTPSNFLQTTDEIFPTQNQDQFLIQSSNSNKILREAVGEIEEKKEKFWFTILTTYEKYIADARHGEKLTRQIKFRQLCDAGILLKDELQLIRLPKKFETLDLKLAKLKNAKYDSRVLLRKKKALHKSLNKKLCLKWAGIYADQRQFKMEESIDLLIERCKFEGIEISKSRTQLRRDFKKFYSLYQAVIDAGRYGKKQYKETHRPDQLRDNTVFSVGDQVSIDGVRLPFFINGERWTLLVAFDVASSACCGFVLSKNEDKEATLILIYRIILFLGKKPIVIQPDHGAAFMSHDVQQFLELLNIGCYPPAVRNAAAKYAERFIQILEQLFKMVPTFSGSSIASKPAHYNQGEFEAKRMKKDLDAGIDFTPEVANETIMKIITMYNDQIIKSGRNKGKKRIDLFNAGRGPGVSKQELSYLMMKKLVKKPNKNGIKIGKDYYFNNAMFGRKKSYIVRYDLVYNDSIYCSDAESGEFLFEAYKRNLVHPQVGVFGTEKEASEVFKGIQLQKSFDKITYDSLEMLFEQEIKPNNNFLLHKMGITRNAKQNNVSKIMIDKNLIDAEIVNEVENKFLLKTGTDNIALESLEEKPIEVNKKNSYFYRDIIKK
ncbi:MAG TPA: hypothetical protein DHV28_13675 [Ignavibacteriales bacterium]|nr:hypothetical protein [Ignavibacteriales bacterium]